MSKSKTTDRNREWILFEDGFPHRVFDRGSREAMIRRLGPDPVHVGKKWMGMYPGDKTALVMVAARGTGEVKKS